MTVAGAAACVAQAASCLAEAAGSCVRALCQGGAGPEPCAGALGALQRLQGPSTDTAGVWAAHEPRETAAAARQGSCIRAGVQVTGDMDGTRVQHISVGLHHVGALAATTSFRQLPGRTQVCAFDCLPSTLPADHLAWAQPRQAAGRTGSRDA